MRYAASPIKRERRTRAELAELDGALVEVLDAIRPATLRQLFYAATVRGLVEKTEAGYDLVGRRLGVLRRAREELFDWLVDNTRWMRKPSTYIGLHQLLEHSARVYRRDLWQQSPVTVEV
jgi:hypothetical protein